VLRAKFRLALVRNVLSTPSGAGGFKILVRTRAVICPGATEARKESYNRRQIKRLRIAVLEQSTVY
jgi:hypothetical protein